MAVWSYEHNLVVVQREKLEFRRDLNDVHLFALSEDNEPFTRLIEADEKNLPKGYKVVFQTQNHHTTIKLLQVDTKLKFTSCHNTIKFLWRSLACSSVYLELFIFHGKIF